MSGYFCVGTGETPPLLFDDPLTMVGPIESAVLVAEVSHETTGLKDAGRGQLGMLASEINRPHAIPHVLQVAGCQRVTFVACCP
jgi:hypothetical protein